MALSTMMTTFTSSPTATATILVFATPFPQPASCSSLLITAVSQYSDYGTTSSSTFLLPNTSDPRYTACLAPAGDQFAFSPAVCLQGWPAWWLGRGHTSTLSGAATTTTTTAANVSTTYVSRAYVSTAYCCAPGYSMPYQGVRDDPSPSCEQAFLSSTSSSGAVFLSMTTLSVAKLPAWHISWEPTDMPTLSPQPPAIEGDERIVQWVPGSDPQRERRGEWGGGISLGFFFFLVVGVPLVIGAGTVACLTNCCVCLRTPRDDTGEVGTQRDPSNTPP
ncbi:hypothetical protein OQA88_964 [Cercophora sp. LCS_1]